MNSSVLVALPFAGPVSFYQLIARFQSVIFEIHEYFEKSTYRNRCHIAGPDGLLRLTVPILHGRSHRQLTKDTRIAYDHEWRKQHWKSFEAAYRRSPYFEYYEDQFEAVYESRPERLIEFNLAVHNFIVKSLGITINQKLSETYEDEPTVTDMRSSLLPAKPALDVPHYSQVFASRHGFLPDLSILDLIFNEGPYALNALGVKS